MYNRLGEFTSAILHNGKRSPKAPFYCRTDLSRQGPSMYDFAKLKK